MPCFLQFMVLVVGHIGRVFRSGSGITKIPMSLQLFFRPLCFALPKEANAPKRTTQFLFGAFCFRGFLRALSAPLLHSVFCGKLSSMFQIGVDVLVAAAGNCQYNDVRGFEFQAVERSQSVC